MTNIANLRHRVEVQTYTERQCGDSATLKTWNTIMTVFAEIISVKGYITFDTQQINEAITHKVTIRYQSGITSENWLLMNSRRFRIRNIQNLVEKNRFLVLLCEEVFRSTDPFLISESAIGDSLQDDLPPQD